MNVNDAIKKYQAKHGDMFVPQCVLELNDGDDENESLNNQRSEESTSTAVLATTEDYGQAITSILQVLFKI